MNQELGFIERAIEFLYSIGLPPQRILRGIIALLLIGLVVGGLYFVGFSDLLKSAPREVVETEEDTDADAGEGSERTTYEFELSPGQQIDELLYYVPGAPNYVVLAGEIEQQREKIETLRARSDLTEDQSFNLDRVLLRNEKTLLERKLSAKIDQPEDIANFRAFAQKFVDGPNEQLKSLAGFALVDVSTSVFATSPNAQSSADAIEAYRNNQFAYVNSFDRSNLLLESLLNSKKINSNNKLVDATIQALGKQLANSKVDSVKILSEQVLEFGLFAELGLRSLEERVRYKSPDALQNLDDALRVLESHPEVDMAKWRKLIRAYEPSLAIGQKSVFETGWQIISGLVEKLAETDERKSELSALLANQLKRAKLIGTEVDISGDSVTGGKLKPMADNTLLIFADRNEDSVKLMARLRSRVMTGGQFYTPIVSFLDDFSENDLKQIGQIPRGIQISSFQTAQKLSKDFAIDFYPYTVLLDKQNFVLDIDLSLVQAANRVAALKKDSASAVKAGNDGSE